MTQSLLLLALGALAGVLSGLFGIGGGAVLVPAMVLGIFWPRTSRAGAVAGMLAGLAVTTAYMLANTALGRAWLGSGPHLLWDIQPISAGVFGVAAGLMATVAASLLTRPDPHGGKLPSNLL